MRRHKVAAKLLIGLGLAGLVAQLFIPAVSVAALSREQKAIFDKEIGHFDHEVIDAQRQTDPAAGAPLQGCNAAEEIWNYFTQTRSLAPGVAAGFLGNMVEEAHFEPRLVEYSWQNSRGEISRAGQPTSLDDQIPPVQYKDSAGRIYISRERRSGGDQLGGGYGLIQFTSPGRKDQLQIVADELGQAPGTRSVQLEAIWRELNGPYRNSTLDPLTALGADADPRAASEIITRHYEIPGRMSQAVPRRQTQAANYFTQFTSGQGCPAEG
ncbi:MAG TPA: phage tail tip lysozyme [Candidatus Limnocylindria bacterium]|nr:phage tail tip lysozyme [Candidatus Limnocylindria bacterium]